jgi:type II secretory pathway pseudopilin PulG
MVRRRDARRARAFTLLEVAMALLLVSGLLAIAVPSLDALTGARLRETTSTIQGLVRDTYARSALSGKPCRIVIDLDAHSYWVEESDGAATLTRAKQSPDRQGKGLLNFLDERLEGTEDSDDPEDQEKRRLLSGPVWSQVDDTVGTPQRLPPEVTFYGVWAEHLDDRVRGGQAAIVFFPGGHAEEAHITLTDDETGNNTLTVVLEPLTGETFIDDKIPDVP